MTQPTTAIPNWASDATFTTGVESGLAPTLAFTAGEISQGLKPGKAVARKMNWLFRLLSQWLTWHEERITSNVPVVNSYTSSGTWSKLAGATYIDFTLVGSGAGGTGNTGLPYPGTGGGGGQIMTVRMPAALVPSALNVTVGTGGAVNNPGANSTVYDGVNFSLLAIGGSVGHAPADTVELGGALYRTGGGINAAETAGGTGEGGYGDGGAGGAGSSTLNVGGGGGAGGKGYGAGGGGGGGAAPTDPPPVYSPGRGGGGGAGGFGGALLAGNGAAGGVSNGGAAGAGAGGLVVITQWRSV